MVIKKTRIKKDFKRVKRVLCAQVSEDEYNHFLKQADERGVSIAGLVRVRLFRDVKKLRKPPKDIVLLGSLMGYLLTLTGILNTTSETMSRIEGSLKSDQFDRFHHDRTLRILQGLSSGLLRLFTQLEAVLAGLVL